MPFRKLRSIDGSGYVSLPKDDLVRDNVILQSGEIPRDQQLHVERIGERCHVVRAPVDGDLPQLEDCEAIQRIAASTILQQQAQPTAGPTAD